MVCPFSFYSESVCLSSCLFCHCPSLCAYHADVRTERESSVCPMKGGLLKCLLARFEEREMRERESKKYLVRRSKKDTDSKQARKHLFCSCFLEERIMKILCLLFKTDIYWRTQFWLKFFHPGFVVFVVVSHHVIKKPNENRYDVQQNEKQKKKKSPPECITSKHLYLLNK